MKTFTQECKTRQWGLTLCTFGMGRQKGFSTIEILIAFGVGIIFLSAAMMISFSRGEGSWAPNGEQHSYDTGQAVALDSFFDNRGLASTTRQFGQYIVDFLKPNGWNKDPLAINSTESDPYSYTPDVLDISPCMKQIIATTTWESLNGRDRHITFGTTLSNINEAIALGPSGCDPLETGSWQYPIKKDNLSILNFPGASDATGIKVKAFDKKLYAFITSNPQSKSGVEFTVIDVTDNKISTDVPATLSYEKGLLGIAIGGDYAYVLNNDIENQLQVIKISDPKSPEKLSTSYTLPGIDCKFKPETCQRIGKSIFYYNGYLFIGTGYMAGVNPEFHIYSINSSGIPTPIGKLDVDHNINDIVVKDNNAYLATSANYGELTIVDVSDKTLTDKVKSLPPDYKNPNINNRKFNTDGDEDGRKIYILGKYIYLGLGRKAGDSPSGKYFYILNSNNMNSITKAGSYDFNLTQKTDGVSGIVVQGKTIFVSTTDKNQSLYILDASNSTNPVNKNLCLEKGKTAINLSNAVTGIEYKNNRVFAISDTGEMFLKILYENNNNECEK